MFFHVKMQHDILLHPKYFGKMLIETIRQKLHSEVQGTCMGKYGYVILVTGIENIGDGLIQSGVGFVMYPVKYKAVVFRPFPNQVIDAIVTSVNKVGLFAQIGPMTCFVSNKCLCTQMQYCPDAIRPCYKSVEEDLIIKEGDKIRVRILNTRISQKDSMAVATMQGDYLGPI